MGEVFGLDVVVPKAVAMRSFEQHLLPHLDKFNDLEKAMAISFFKNPDRAIPEIVKRYKIESFDQLVDLLSSPETPESAKAFLMAVKEALEMGIYELRTIISLRRKLLPKMPKDLEKLEKTKETLEKLDKIKAKKILRAFTVGAPKIVSYGTVLHIYKGLASKALGREVEPNEELTFEEAYKVISWLHDYWKNLGFLDAEKRGWTWKDEEGLKRWIWDRNFIWMKFNEDLLPLTTRDLEKLKRIKEYLEELEKKGAKKFLKIQRNKEEKRVILWSGSTLYVSSDLASEGTKRITFRKVKEFLSSFE